MSLDKYATMTAWGCMTAAAVLAVAAQQDWTSPKGALVGLGLCLSALGAALMHPLTPTQEPKP